MANRDAQRMQLVNQVAGLLASKKKTGLSPLPAKRNPMTGATTGHGPQLLHSLRTTGSVIPGNSKRGKRIRQAHKLGPHIHGIFGGETG